MKDLPCWLNSDDKEVANALLALDWSWLDQEEPESWEEQIWERKICKYRGWQFWSVPGEVCLLISRNGAVFGLCLEAMNPKPADTLSAGFHSTRPLRVYSSILIDIKRATIPIAQSHKCKCQSI